MTCKVPAKKICQVYQSEIAGRIDDSALWDIGARLYEICSEVPGVETIDDNDWIKDAGQFINNYEAACQGWFPNFLRGLDSVEKFLFNSVDTLLSGCHALISPADEYIEGGIELLDTIFEWDGKGNLYQFYLSKK